MEGFKFKNEGDNAIITEAAEHIARYVEAKRGLRELGVVRTNKDIPGDYAEWIAARLLDLELCSSATEQSIDAFDAEGRKYQIKSRQVDRLNQAKILFLTDFDMAEPGHDPFDFLIGVLFSPALEVLAVVKIPVEVVWDLGRLRTSGRGWKMHWNRSVWSDPRVERIFWADDTGGRHVRLERTTRAKLDHMNTRERG